MDGNGHRPNEPDAGQSQRRRWREARHRHRCGLLAAWSTAWLAGRVSYDDVIDAVVGEEVHRVAGLPGRADAVPLGWALSALRERGESRLRAVLPVPGDPRGLPGPGPFSAAAMLAGEGVLGNGLGLTPDVGDATVLWTAHEVNVVAPDPITLVEADHDLAVTLRTAARALTELDVARWRPEAAALLQGSSNGERRLRLPPGHDQRALGLAERAQRLTDVLELALADAPGAAVTGHDARGRDEALRPLATAVRRALVAAYNA